MKPFTPTAHQILDSLKDNISPIITIDQSARILLWSEACTKLFGFKRNDVIGKSLIDVIIPEHLKDGMRHIFSGTIPDLQDVDFSHPIETEAVTADGTIIPVEITISYFEDKGQGFYSAIYRDISKHNKKLKNEIKQREIERKQREFLEENIFNFASDAITINDEQGKILKANDELCKMTGYQKKELLGKHLLELSPDDHSPEPISSLLKKGYLKGYQSQLRCKNGNTIIVEMNAALTFNDTGQPLGGIATYRDITERKKYEDSLKQTNQKMNKIFSAVIEAIVVTDGQGCCTEVNDSFLKMLGYDREEIIGKQIMEFVPENHIPEPFIDEVRKTGFKKQYESFLRRKDGTIFPVETNVIGLFDDTGNLVETVASIYDITDRKEYERQRKSFTLQLLSLLEEERKKIAYDIHDSSSMTKYNLSMLINKLKALAVEQDEYKIFELALKTEDVFSDFWATLKNLSYKLNDPSLEAGGLSEALHAECNRIMQEHSISINMVENIEGVNISNDIAYSLFRIFQESLNNIIKHSKAKKIDITLAQKNAAISLSISDNGIGFDVAEQKKTSIGLGLISMSERATALNGSLNITSHNPRGTTIKAVIPIGDTGND